MTERVPALRWSIGGWLLAASFGLAFFLTLRSHRAEVAAQIGLTTDSTRKRALQRGPVEHIDVARWDS